MELLRELMSFQCEDMQKTPMIMDKSGKFTFGTWVILAANHLEAWWPSPARPSTYCDPQNKPKYEQEEVPGISRDEIWILLYFIDGFKGNVLQ